VQPLRIVTTSDDFDAYARHVVLDDPKTRRLFVILGSVMTVCTAPVPVFLIVAFSGKYLMALVAGAMVAALAFVAAWDIARRSGERKYLRLASQGAFGAPGERELSIDESGLRELGPETDIRVPWDAVAEIGDTGTHVFVRAADAHVLIIPKAGGAAGVESFVQTLRGGMERHSSA
jgi:hypothetical protein